MVIPAVDIVHGDITQVETDAIVNAANGSLMGGGGVDGAIHRAGGPAILRECRDIIKRIGHCDTGQAVYTTAGNLPASYVIHTVGPVWHGGNENEQEDLRSSYRNSLDLAQSLSCKSIAFPNISTGIYGYPKVKAAETALSEISIWQEEHGHSIRIMIVCFDEENYRIYKKKSAKGDC